MDPFPRSPGYGSSPLPAGVPMPSQGSHSGHSGHHLPVQGGVANPALNSRPSQLNLPQQSRARQTFLKDRIILIAGASRGIGPAIARAATEVGAIAVLAGSDEMMLKEEAKTLMREGLQALFAPMEMTNEAQIRDVFSGIHERFGRLDFVMINTGLARLKPVAETSLEEWMAQIYINLTGPFLCMREALRLMSYLREGQILVMNSMAAKQRLAQPSAAYCATRAGLATFIEQFREEARMYGIRVTQLLLSAAETAWWDTNDDRVRRPEQALDPVELARQIVMLCRPRTNLMPEDVVMGAIGGF